MIGIIDVLRVGDRPGNTIGVLNILNSDLEGGGVQVLNGTANLIASDVPGASVGRDSSLYASMGSRLRSLTTQSDSYTSIQGSIVGSTSTCQLFSTVLIEDSLLSCRRIQFVNVGDDTTTVEIRAVALPSVTVETTEAFEVNGGSVDVENAVVTTGSIVVMRDVDFDVSASVWTNAGGIEIQGSQVEGFSSMAIVGGTQFRELGGVRVAGRPELQQLIVDGASTELEIDGDLRIGEFLNHLGNPLALNGHARASNGATVIVHGTLAIRPQGVLTIESGATVYAATLANEGTIAENGGTLVVPEAGATLGGVASLVALAWRSLRRNREPTHKPE